MTKYLIIIAILVLLYLYWKYQQTKTDDIIKRKGKNKENFWDASNFDINSADSDNESTNSDYDK